METLTPNIQANPGTMAADRLNLDCCRGQPVTALGFSSVAMGLYEVIMKSKSVIMNENPNPIGTLSEYKILAVRRQRKSFYLTQIQK